jgi:hypothetical protein
MNSALEEAEWSAARPGRSLLPGNTRHPLYRGLDGPQGRFGQMRKISPPTGIRSPDRPARSQSLYRLSYRAHDYNMHLLRTCKEVCGKTCNGDLNFNTIEENLTKGKSSRIRKHCMSTVQCTDKVKFAP